MASPSGTNTVERSGSTACAPTSSPAGATTRAESFASRSMVCCSALYASSASVSDGVTWARSVTPGATRYSARMARTAPMTAWTRANRSSASSSSNAGLACGHAAPATMGSRSPGNARHNASVMNGMIGCNSRSAVSKTCARIARATSPPGAWPYTRGFTCSRYQSASSDHMNW